MLQNKDSNLIYEWSKYGWESQGAASEKKKNAWLTGLIRLENLGHLAAIYGYNLEV